MSTLTKCTHQITNGVKIRDYSDRLQSYFLLFPGFLSCNARIVWQQECIPVGCILPSACWPYPSMHCWGCTCPGGCTCLGGVPVWGVYLPWVCVPAQGVTCWGVYLPRGYLPRYSPPWTEWQTGAKILPCPKLRLRAVKTEETKKCMESLLVLKGFPDGRRTKGNWKRKYGDVHPRYAKTGHEWNKQKSSFQNKIGYRNKKISILVFS